MPASGRHREAARSVLDGHGAAGTVLMAECRTYEVM
jgi:hypothetical protein